MSIVYYPPGFPGEGSLSEMEGWWKGYDEAYRDAISSGLYDAAEITSQAMMKELGMTEEDNDDLRKGELLRCALLTEHVDAAFRFVRNRDVEKLKDSLLDDVVYHCSDGNTGKFVLQCIRRDGTPGPSDLREELVSFTDGSDIRPDNRITNAYINSAMWLCASDVSEELGISYIDAYQNINHGFYFPDQYYREQFDTIVLGGLDERIRDDRKALSGMGQDQSGPSGIRPSERLVMEAEGMGQADDGKYLGLVLD